ncbi:MAG TPA: hypothetical protein VIV35_06125, partial [Chitinophagaceae bacterium]
MNKYSVSLLPVVLLFFLSNSYQQKKHRPPVPEGISRWTGTVTFVEITNIANAAFTVTSERNITASFHDALPTMYRDDGATELNFTDDK